MAERDEDIGHKIEQILKQECFQGFTEEEYEQLAALLTKKDFPAGETIVNEGDPVDFVYLIIDGEADVYKTMLKDQKTFEDHVAVLGPGHSIGLSKTGFFSLSGMRTATVISKTKLETYRLGVAVFRGFTLANSHASDVMKKRQQEAGSDT